MTWAAAQTARNPWLDVPLDDYEGHVSLPAVGQAPVLAQLLADAVAAHAPDAVAVLGCAGGNGFDRLGPPVRRVVGVDLNPAYVARARDRHAATIARLELHTCDLERAQVPAAPVDLVFAGLFFEHVSPARVLPAVRSLVRQGGVLVAVLQLPGSVDTVAPSPFTSVQALRAVMRLVPPGDLRRMAAGAGFGPIAERQVPLPGGKAFCVQTYQG